VAAGLDRPLGLAFTGSMTFVVQTMRISVSLRRDETQR
jgi:hypothetical protein